MKTLWQWLAAKFGRLVTSLGVILSGVESLDISAIKDPLEQLIGHKWARHQYVANQHPKA
jgi:hypothetical protein